MLIRLTKCAILNIKYTFTTPQFLFVICAEATFNTTKNFWTHQSTFALVCLNHGSPSTQRFGYSPAPSRGNPAKVKAIRGSSHQPSGTSPFVTVTLYPKIPRLYLYMWVRNPDWQRFGMTGHKKYDKMNTAWSSSPFLNSTNIEPGA